MPLNRMSFMNTYIDNITMEETLAYIDTLIRRNQKSYVLFSNVDCLVKIEKDKELKEIFDNADLNLADGKPLIWISKLYKTLIKEKVSGSDLFPLLCKMSSEKKYKIFFLGAAEGVAAKAADNLVAKYPELLITGTYSPPFGFENDEKEITHILSVVKDADPDILVVGLGCPKQEKFIYKYHKELSAPLSIALGASIDFEAGNVKRAPKWMRNVGLEWLYRITQDPKRLIKRYLVDDIKIISLALKYRKSLK